MLDAAQDLMVLCRLRCRHAWTNLVWWLYVTGSDFAKDRKPADRLYQLYIATAIAVTIAALWFCLLDAATSVGMAMSLERSSQATRLLHLIPAPAFIVVLVHYLRTPPIKLTHPDISLLANMLRPASWATLSIVSGVLAATAGGALAGFAIGKTLQQTISPCSSAILVSLSLACAVALAWLIAMMRHIHLKDGLRIDMASAIQANSLYADLQPLRSWAPHAPEAYEEARRRRIMASRRPILKLPESSGHRLLIAKATISHIRQREGLPHLALWGIVVIPAQALLIATSSDAGLMVAWAMMAMMLAPRAKELTRVFKDDRRVRLIGDAIDCSPATLLLLDSLPAASTVLVLGLAATCVGLSVHPVGPLLTATALVVPVSAMMVLVFAGGIDPTAAGHAHLRPSFETLIVAYVLIITLLAFIGPLWSATASIICAVILWLWFRWSVKPD